MFPILNQLPAQSIGMPDVCLTQPPGPVPPIPIPYPNMANEALGFPAVNHVLMGGAPAHNIGTIISPTLGDLPGFAGVASGTVMGPGSTSQGSAKLIIGGLPAKRVTSVGMGNGVNCTSIALSPNQIKVWTRS